MVNWSIDFLFFVDIIINFRTSYINPMTGDESTNPKEIAKNYLKGRFWVDLLATVPIDQIVGVFIHKTHSAKF